MYSTGLSLLYSGPPGGSKQVQTRSCILFLSHPIPKAARQYDGHIGLLQGPYPGLYTPNPHRIKPTPGIRPVSVSGTSRTTTGVIGGIFLPSHQCERRSRGETSQLQKTEILPRAASYGGKSRSRSQIRATNQKYPSTRYGSAPDPARRRPCAL